MKASRFTDAQKAFILKQGADGHPVAEICRKAGISRATYFNWKKKYDGLLPDEMRRLKQLEDENSKLKKLVADLSLDKAMLQDVLRQTGYPGTIRIDQGSEFISRDLDLWAYADGITLDFSRPGKPTDNAFIEAFNSKLRAECLNAHWFMSLEDAREKLRD
jgi:putative transposase